MKTKEMIEWLEGLTKDGRVGDVEEDDETIAAIIKSLQHYEELKRIVKLWPPSNELIKFLIETEYINYSEDYEIIDKIVAKLKHYDTLLKLKVPKSGTLCK